MKIILAPMEGVIDYRMRQLLTEIGGYDRCVTEFIRVSERPVPGKVFRRLCPELEHGGRTRSGVPVFMQLLGGDPRLMADSAAVAVRSGGLGIDLNFGCPAKTVNRRDGGSVLLREPNRIHDIVSAVRDRVDSSIPVCAKIRLGFDSADRLEEIAEGIEDAGATELCIHARTRLDGYRPPARWRHIARLRQPKSMQLIVNGEIWNAGDATAALRQSGCDHLMIGRGGLACPDLAQVIRRDLAAAPVPSWNTLDWSEVVPLVARFYSQRPTARPRHAGNRTKQWLGYLRKQYREAEVLFEEIKRLRDPDLIQARLQHEVVQQHRSVPARQSRTPISVRQATLPSTSLIPVTV